MSVEALLDQRNFFFKQHWGEGRPKTLPEPVAPAVTKIDGRLLRIKTI